MLELVVGAALFIVGGINGYRFRKEGPTGRALLAGLASSCGVGMLWASRHVFV